MSPAEVADSLQTSEPHERVGGPYAQEDFADGVKVFYDEGKLACAAMDAFTGRQDFLAGFALWQAVIPSKRTTTSSTTLPSTATGWRTPPMTPSH
ncbi:hypothetical protein ACIQ6K_35980 [Streptomyces sp. NPDC096354]|uniref:hypothetical protein n=1 Tax=Streptomyces sp. NPDC096354 TaxID=3366088 RepID=UPI0037F6DCF8